MGRVIQSMIPVDYFDISIVLPIQQCNIQVHYSKHEAWPDFFSLLKLK
jgi:hypothetical protein